MKAQFKIVKIFVLLALGLSGCLRYEMPDERLADILPGDSVAHAKEQMVKVITLFTKAAEIGNFDVKRLTYYYKDSIELHYTEVPPGEKYLKKYNATYDTLLSDQEIGELREGVTILKQLGVNGCEYSDVFHVHLFHLDGYYSSSDQFKYLCLESQLDTLEFKRSEFKVVDKKDGVYFLKPKPLK